MQTLIEWQGFWMRADAVLAAVNVVWWCGAMLSLVSVMTALGCAIRWDRGMGSRPTLPPQSEFLGFGLPVQRGSFISHTEGVPVSSRPKTSPGPRTVQASSGFGVTAAPGANLASCGSLKVAV